MLVELEARRQVQVGSHRQQPGQHCIDSRTIHNTNMPSVMVA
jgi:hypothetical protein